MVAGGVEELLLSTATSKLDWGKIQALNMSENKCVKLANISTEVEVTKRSKITCCGGSWGTKWGKEIIGDGHRGKRVRDFFQFSGTYISTTSTA
jgi:Fe-S oxidoreductase